MADWAKPVLADPYANHQADLKARDVDAATMAEAPTTPPTGFIRWNTSLNKFQRWDGAAWQDLVISVAGGGTGGTTSLGTMAFQNAISVSITGGTIAGLTSLTMSGNILFDADGTRNVGSNAARVGTAYIKTGLRIPVGPDAWVVS